MDDHSVSFEEFSCPRVAVLGSRSLSRYASEMLVRGFGELGWDLVPLEDAELAVIQLHGAPHSVSDDHDILDLNFSKLRAATILIHRPDEIREHHPDLRSRLLTLGAPGPLVFLGDRHVSDPFFTDLGRPVRVIPHGFFSAKRPGRSEAPVIGTHTTWGEMRSIEHALRLIVETFVMVPPGTFVGYLGGVPREALAIDAIERLIRSLGLAISVTVTPDYDQVQGAPEKHVLVVNPGSARPPSMTPLFNIQIYRHGERIRTGESSGSVHECPCIPVIAEMNGAERIEGLDTIKVPYGDVNDISSLDFYAGAKLIANVLADGSAKKMLKRNAERALELSPRHIASLHSELLLGETRRSLFGLR